MDTMYNMQPAINEILQTEAERRQAIVRYNKLTLVVLMTQFGKTFEALERVLHDIEDDPYHIHIYFTMNTRGHNRQTKSRGIEKLGDRSVVSLSTGGDATCVDAAIGRVLGGDARLIVMCSNHCRFEQLLGLAERLVSNRLIRMRVSVHFDEIHQYISQVSHLVACLDRMDGVEAMYGYTATPDDALEHTGTVRCRYMSAFNDHNYYRIRDMAHSCIRPLEAPFDTRNTSMSPEFAAYIYGGLKVALGSGSPSNARVFAPAAFYRASHELVAKMAWECDPMCAVVVMNGESRSVRWQVPRSVGTLVRWEQECYKLSQAAGEFDEQLFEAYEAHPELQGRRCVITGKLCVGMGQTLAGEKLGNFDFGVFGPGIVDGSSEELERSVRGSYQLLGRTTGRVKGLDGFRETTILCPSEDYISVVEYERAVETASRDRGREFTLTLSDWRSSFPRRVQRRRESPKRGRPRDVYETVFIAAQGEPGPDWDARVRDIVSDTVAQLLPFPGAKPYRPHNPYKPDCFVDGMWLALGQAQAQNAALMRTPLQFDRLASLPGMSITRLPTTAAEYDPKKNYVRRYICYKDGCVGVGIVYKR